MRAGLEQAVGMRLQLTAQCTSHLLCLAGEHVLRLNLKIIFNSDSLRFHPHSMDMELYASSARAERTLAGIQLNIPVIVTRPICPEPAFGPSVTIMIYAPNAADVTA